MGRDFYGYANEPPQAAWPGDARVAVSFVLNIEEGAELALSAGDERNEAHHEINHEVRGAPDLCMESHFEYGTRIGYWRIARLFAQAGVPITLNACGRAIATTPWLARDAIERGHEICCHGWRWEAHAGMDEATERTAIARGVEAIRAACAVAPVGWHTKSSASVNTRRLLVEHGGFLYDSDAYNDELPFYVEVGGRPHLVVPYCFDSNDMRFFDTFAFARAADFSEYVNDAFDWLWREGAHCPRMLSVGLHLRIIGRPARIGGLERVLNHMRAKGGVWFARRDQIARHWLRHHPPG